ncbi:hypothetical protein [Geomonas oryzae]|uniref:hypothetical protein n=1 Tax=Geomonas oryzae TaxID=2364273 RepID=UPI00100B2DE4|nr:hypothetical protein [Geomonas oryzae]
MHGTRFTAAARTVHACLICLFGVLLQPQRAAADLLNGYLEWDYSHLQSQTRDATGTSGDQKGDGLTQKYNLLLNKTFLPLLSLRAGYLWESDRNWLTTNGTGARSSITTSLPSVDLLMGSPMLNASLGYSKRKEADSSAGTSLPDRYNEDYHASIGWRPEGLPAVSLLLNRINTFDGRRQVEDSGSDRATLGITYNVKNLDLKYLFNYNDQKDKLVGLDVSQASHTGMASYSGQFFDERVSLYSTYNVTGQGTDTSSSGRGMVDQQLTLVSGLFALTGPGQQYVVPETATLGSYPLLVDGNVGTSAGVDLGPQPGLQAKRNFGFDFQNPQTTVNRVLVWVATSNGQRLPDAIARQYAFTVYQSQDNLTWTRVSTVSGLTLDPFQNRFEIKFAPATTRYLKVVAAPLDPTQVPPGIIGFPSTFNLFVTEIQAFDEVPAASVQKRSSVLSQMLNTDVKVRLTDSPALYYDGSLFLTSSQPDGFTKWTVSNALMADHRFNDWISGSARGAREDDEEPKGHRGAFVYSALLRMTPLSTLSDTITYSGRRESFQGKNSGADSLFLSNTAELYQGVNVNASGGLSLSSTDSGARIRAYNALLGVNLKPRGDLSLNANYSWNSSAATGAGTSETSVSTQREDIGVTYRPFTTLYLTGSFSLLQQSGQTGTTFQNYGINWSPFPDGTLQFNFAYSENLASLNQQKSKMLTPGLTWKITPRTTLDASYQRLNTSSSSGTESARTVSAVLRSSF